MSKPIFLNYVSAAYPLLWIQTHEEFRAMTTFAKELSQHSAPFQIYSWDRIDAVKNRKFNKGILQAADIDVEGLDDPFAVLDWASSKNGMPENSVLFLQDYHYYIKDDNVCRKIRNVMPYFKAMGKVLVIISHSLKLPDEIEKEITVIPFKLPDVNELRITLNGICQAAEKQSTKKKIYPENDLPILEAALGMTALEAENAFALSLCESKCLDVDVINREKAAIIKKTELLEVVENKETLDDVGGLDRLKDWLISRKDNATKKARDFGLQPPKGLLLGGLPGTGKSLSAKAAASVLKRPLLRLDMGKVFGSYVGESEQNIRKCLDIADTVAPCVLWIDELEKAFAGTKGGADSKGGGNEVAMRVYNTFLTWFEEKTTDVFIVATANNVQAIDEALLSRLNTIFWVDLPDKKQREEIIAIHLKKIDRDPKKFNLGKIAEASDKFSGREIRNWIQDSSLNYAFKNGHELCDNDLITTAKEVVPQAIMMAEEIHAYRQWAKKRQVKSASSQIEEVVVDEEPQTGRKMNFGDEEGVQPGGIAG